MQKTVRKVILSCLGISGVFALLDYWNLPTQLGLNTTSINWDIASLVISNIIVVGLYLITYHVLDKRNVTKEKNQRAVAKYMLVSTYNDCIDKVKFFADDANAELAARKCDFDKLQFQDPVFEQYLSLPFDYHDSIIEFGKTGIITRNEFRAYTKIREYYRSHLMIRIMFFDKRNFADYKKEELIEEIKKAKRALKRSV